METIKNYLDNMFSRLPKTKEIETLKYDLLSNMEDKYEELKKEGKTENEAIGVVISEFGNIDELLNELDININNTTSINIKDISPSTDTNFPTIGEKEAYNYLKVRKQTALFISIGVFLCITGVSLLILLYQLIDNKIILQGFSDNATSTIPLIPLFILVIPAIALFVYSGLKLEKYNFIEKGEFSLSSNVNFSLNQDYDLFRPKFTKGIILGVCLCVVSPLCIFIGNIISESATVYGVSLLLFIVSLAVIIFINLSVMHESYKLLLQLDEYSPKNREANKVIGSVASVVWPITVVVYLFIGFVFKAWHISWIVFPIVGILFGSFTSIYKGIKKVS